MSGLEPYRRRLDEIDGELARLLGERFEICREVARHKAANGIPMMQPDRVAEVRGRYLERGRREGLPDEFTGAYFDVLIAATCKAEDELMAQLGAADGGRE